MRYPAPRLDLVFGGRAEPDIRLAGAPIGGQHGCDILRSFREAELIEGRRGADELPQVLAPSRGCAIVENVCH